MSAWQQLWFKSAGSHWWNKQVGHGNSGAPGFSRSSAGLSWMPLREVKWSGNEPLADKRLVKGQKPKWWDGMFSSQRSRVLSVGLQQLLCCATFLKITWKEGSWKKWGDKLYQCFLCEKSFSLLLVLHMAPWDPWEEGGRVSASRTLIALVAPVVRSPHPNHSQDCMEAHWGSLTLPRAPLVSSGPSAPASELPVSSSPQACSAQPWPHQAKPSPRPVSNHWSWPCSLGWPAPGWISHGPGSMELPASLCTAVFLSTLGGCLSAYPSAPARVERAVSDACTKAPWKQVAFSSCNLFFLSQKLWHNTA